MIYTVGGIKGGSGKTTVATNLAVWLSKRKDVLLVDADEQETATDFTSWREETLKGEVGYTSIKLTGENVRREILKLKGKFEHIVIDTGGRDTTSQRAAIFVSDVLLLPFNPRSFDIWTVVKLQKLLEEIRSVKPEELKAYSFLNRADVRGSDNNDAGDALAQVEGIKFLVAHLGNRKAFSNAAGRGLSVIELNPPDEKATTELTNLFELIAKE
jgi:chromosome partitioning protein